MPPPRAPCICSKQRSFSSLEEAVADLNGTFATTARERGQLKPVLAANAAMTEAATRVSAGEKLGLLFGPERTGLDNEEIALADKIISFPVNPAYASLNLAQAVLLVGYEWMKAAHSGAPPFQPPERSPAAPRKMILSFFGYLEGELERVGFFRPLAKRPVMQNNLRNMFHRMNMSEQDVRSFRGMIVRLVEGPRAEKPKKKPQPPTDDKD